jgi:RNA polymerase sigma-70 factor (ECF subfamily)
VETSDNDNRESLEADLMRRYGRGVFVIIHKRVRNRSVAEELSQETFRIVLEKIRQGEVREPERLSGFITGVARNVTNNYVRRGPRPDLVVGIEEAEYIADPAPNPLDRLLEQEKREIARQLIQQLPSARDREVLFRFYVDGDEKEQICEDLGLSSPQFNVVLCRALKRCKKSYEKLMASRRAMEQSQGMK